MLQIIFLPYLLIPQRIEKYYLFTFLVILRQVFSNAGQLEIPSAWNLKITSLNLLRIQVRGIRQIEIDLAP